MTLNEKYAKKYQLLIEQLETEGETTPKKYKDKLLLLIAAVLANLALSTSGWIEDYASVTHTKAVASTARNVARQYRRAGLAVPDIVHVARAALSSTNSAELEEIADVANVELAKALNFARKTTQDAVREAIDSAMVLKRSANLTVRAARGNLVQTLLRQGIPAIRKSNGQYIRLDHYANMVINSEANKAANLGVLDYAHSIGARYVLVSSHYGSCPLCAVYQNRVFSLDSNDTKYPYLYDTPWSEVYNNFHPNCWHTLSVWVEAAHTPDEVAKMQAFSNRSFDVGGEGWTKEQVEAYERGAKAYAAGQKQNAKLYNDRKHHERYLSVLGPDNVPKYFDSFQKMKYNDSVKYDYVQLDYKRQKKLIDNPELALPFADKAAAADAKFTKYLFGGSHPNGLAKGRAFTSRLGYNKNNWIELREEIISKAPKYPATLKGEDVYGKAYTQKMVLFGKKGKPANVVVGWKVDGERTWLATTYIDEV